MFKRIKKLNGWQRIGVALSVAWALYGFYWGNDYGIHQGDWVDMVRNSCYDDAQRVLDDSDRSQQARDQYQKAITLCDQNSDRDWRESIEYHWDYAAICAFIPIPFGWGVVYGLIALVKWIRKGFNVPTDSNLPPPVH